MNGLISQCFALTHRTQHISIRGHISHVKNLWAEMNSWSTFVHSPTIQKKAEDAV